MKMGKYIACTAIGVAAGTIAGEIIYATCGGHKYEMEKRIKELEARLEDLVKDEER